IEVSDELEEIVKEDKPRATVDMRITLDDYAINFLMNVTEDDFWAHIVNATKIDMKTWKQAMAPEVGRSSVARRRHPLRTMALKYRRMARGFRKLSKCDDNRCRIKEITRLVRDGVY